MMHSTQAGRWAGAAAAALLVAACRMPQVAAAAGSDRAEPAERGYDWLQFGGDPAHSLANSAETALTSATVGSLAPVFHVRLADVADGAPVFASAVATAAGTRDVLLVTTRAGDIIALDGRSGAVLWSRSHPAGSYRINRGSRPIYTTASPAIDPDRQYVYTYGLDGFVHKHRLLDGEEVRGHGWPAVVTLKPWDEKGSSDLAIATDSSGVARLYVANGGYPGDRGDYQGHVTTITLSDGSQQVFNTTDSRQAVHFVPAPGTPDSSEVQSAVWARVGVVYDDKTNRVLFATGNGTFDPARGAWGDSVLAIRADGRGRSGMPLDSYTPVDFQVLDDADADLGSTAPALLPETGGRLLAVQGGKDQKLRLLDREELSTSEGVGRTGGEVQVISVPQGGQVLTQPAVWTDPRTGSTWVFVANARGIAGLALGNADGDPRLEPRWNVGGGATSPLVAGGVLYAASGGSLRALDPVSGSMLWESQEIGGIHWESPIVAGGMLYVTDEDGVLWGFAPAGVSRGPK